MKTNLLIPIILAGWFSVASLLLSYSASSQNIDFGKSYINVTKGMNGGTVETGDTLEIRAAFVVKSGIYDSCAYYDFIPVGTAYIPGTIRVLTNEGKIYKQFTDAIWDDQGWISGTSIRINLGYNPAATPATRYRRGRVANTYRPSFYGGTCIMIASFRVRITAGMGSTISTGGGSMTYRSGFNPLQTFTFPNNNVAMYPNYGICTNSIGTNSLGTEFNGTFGSGKPRNRGTSANVPPSYTYNTFTANSPQDYYYGIPNNTSTSNYTTSNNWLKPDPDPDGAGPLTSHRVFTVWDIIGDHTGAASQTLGNPAADTVANNNGGYMLVINASYRIDSAFQQTISNLCPNTYYEISCWMRNICSRCGCDSAGRGASTAGYIPTATNDSSGVYPNITFEVDGVDYYTTGNLLYTGQWVKKGFTFRTGPSQTSFTLKFFNNAPGGGGNDWALDDISVATCSPNLTFTPNNQPIVCAGNAVDLGCYIRSYFNNYTEYKWQKSLDNGVSWLDAGVPGTGSPTWNGSEWEYFVSYPTFVATMADSGTKFRVVVASTVANLTNSNCAFSEISSILTLNVIDCGPPLSTNIISFTGKIFETNIQLKWTTNREETAVQYKIEKSLDGISFYAAGEVAGYNNSTNETNYYNWSEPSSGNPEMYYRIRLVGGNIEKVSRIIRLSNSGNENFATVINPFTNQLIADINVQQSQQIILHLIDNFGKIVRKEKYTVSAGTTKLILDNTGVLPAGIYTLQLKTLTNCINKRVIKQ